MVGKNLPTVKFLFLVFLTWGLLLVCLSFIGLAYFPNYNPESLTLNPPGKYQDYLHRWATWDGGHFRGIAEAGYKESQTVFFPLFPILIRLLMFLGINSLYASIFISIISGFVGLFFLYKLLQLDFQESFIKKSIFFLLIYPTSFIFLTAYSESLFLALSVSAFYFARTKKWKTAYLLTSLSIVTRLIGIAVLISLFVEGVTKGNAKTISFIKKDLKHLLFFFLSLIPLAMYSLYLNLLGKSYYSFLADELYWGRKPTLFWNTILSSFQIATKFSINNIHDLLLLINFVTMLILVLIFIFAYKNLRKSYRVYYLLSVLIPLSSGVTIGLQRYSLVIFPVFIALSLLIRNKFFIITWAIFSSAALVLFLILYINGFPID